jgi:hypothetical protein
MTTIEQAFWEAVLADIVYVDGFTIGMTNFDLAKLIEYRVPKPLANEIGDRFEVLAVKDDPASEYQGVVFRDRTDGTLYVAHRGTAGGKDILVADLDIAAASGAARAQAAAMVNWWNDIALPAGATYTKVKTGNSTAFDPLIFSGNGTAQASGQIASAVAQAAATGKLRVVGHSLGGHLTTVLASVFSNQVSHSSTFNGAGLYSVGVGIGLTLPENLAIQLYGDPLQQLAQALGRPLSIPGAARQDNFYAANGLSVTTSDVLFRLQAGIRIPVYNEYTPELSLNPFANHFLYKLTDALALYRIVEKLQPEQSLATLKSLTERSANTQQGSLEGLLDGLRRTMLGPTVTATAIGDEGGDWKKRIMPAYRTEYHGHLGTLQQAVFGSGTSTAAASVGALANKVRIEALTPSAAALIGFGGQTSDWGGEPEFGAAVALQTLSPFVLTAKAGVEGAQDALTAVWQQAWGSTYAAWQADRTAYQAGDATYDYRFTEQRYAERTAVSFTGGGRMRCLRNARPSRRRTKSKALIHARASRQAGSKSRIAANNAAIT